MPDTSPVTDNAAPIIGGASLLIGGVLAYLGQMLARKAKEEHPITHLPEAAGVAMTLIDQSTQAEIAKDTKRTADAAVRTAEGIERVENILSDFVADAEEDRKRQVEREHKEELAERDRENARLQMMIEEMRRHAGPYTTKARDT